MARGSRLAGKAGMALAVVLAGAAAGAGLYAGNDAFVSHTSPGPCATGCVTDGSVPFGTAGMVTVERRIEGQNRQAVATGNYVSVVLLDPFTFTPGGTVSQGRMLDELAGAAQAQVRANTLVQQGTSKGPMIELLLANEGSSAEEAASAAVAQVESLEGPDHIVAVAGLGLSTQATEDVATELGADTMPMFGAVTTGDQFDGDFYQGLYQVVPDVYDQVQALESVLTLGSTQTVGLVYSTQQTDIYSSDLHQDFLAAFGSLVGLQGDAFTPDSSGSGDEFAGIPKRVCALPGKSQYVLYAGRETQLPALILMFQQTGSCAGHQVTIVSGSDVNALPRAASGRPAGLPGATVTVFYSDIEGDTLPAGLSSQDVESASDQQGCAAAPDPWAVATYNSVIAAATSISEAAAPTKDAVAAAASRLPAEASAMQAKVGFAFAPSGELLRPQIPVYKDAGGNCPLLVAGP